MNSTRFLSHFVSAIENILNAREPHLEAYTAIQNEKGYGRCQKELAGKFKDYLTNSTSLSFMIFILDVCRLLSVFSETTQKKNCPLLEINGYFPLRTSDDRKTFRMTEFFKIHV